MTRRVLIVATVLGFTAAGPAPALGDDGGNVAVGSVGTVQVGSTSSTPSLTASTVAGTADVSVPAASSGQGGNTATGSVGTAQVGGGNSAAGSAGTAQVSAVSGAPSARVGTPLAHAELFAPAAVTGDGQNTASGSVATLQLGGGHAASGSLLEIDASQVEAQPRISVRLAEGTTVGIASFGASPPAVEIVGLPTIDTRLGLQVDREFTFDLAGLTVQATMLGVSPDLLVAADPIAALAVDGRIGTGPNDGNAASGSLGTAQVGSVTTAPTLTLDLFALASSVQLGGASGVDGAGTNAATSSLGTAQAGGGNSATGSAGTGQVGGVSVAPTLDAMTPLGEARLRGVSGIDGGANSADGSLGTVQVGGGNTADGSAGTVQVGHTTVGPTLSATDTPVGEASAGVSGEVAGNGNEATGSLGTVQLGGGNSADGSGVTTQSGGITVAPSAQAADTPAGDVSAGGPTNVGEGSGNEATGSLGTVQIGGGNTTAGSVGTLQVGSSERTLSSVLGGPPTPSAEPAPPTGTVERAAPTGRPTTSVLDVPAVELLRPAAPGALPFTGLDLLLSVVLGTLLAAAGWLLLTSRRAF